LWATLMGSRCSQSLKKYSLTVRYIKYILLGNNDISGIIICSTHSADCLLIGTVSNWFIWEKQRFCLCLVSPYCQLMGEYQWLVTCTSQISWNSGTACSQNGETLNLDRKPFKLLINQPVFIDLLTFDLMGFRCIW